MGDAGDVSTKSRSYRDTMATATSTGRRWSANIETQQTASWTVTALLLHVCEVIDGRITAVTTYCNGGWDASRRARHAAEAPMLRP
jgi:hypothetical protein